MASRAGGTRGVTPQRTALGLVVAAVTAVLLWWTQGDAGQPGDPTPSASDAPAASAPTSDPAPATDPATDAATDLASGLPVVQAADLPPEARDVLGRIDRGGPFKYPDNDGATFENREELLPDRPQGYYREYTVESGPGERGPMRIVAGGDGDLYWTDDHYRSFSWIAR
jgi:ribonuclease T1